MPTDKTPLPRGSKARSYVKRKWGRRTEIQGGREKEEQSGDNVSLV